MDINTKYVMAVFSLMLGLSLGVPYLVSEEQKPSWLMMAIFFLILALVFYLWIMREQRSAEDAAEDALDEAEKSLKKVEIKATDDPVPTAKKDVPQAKAAPDVAVPATSTEAEVEEALEEVEPEPVAQKAAPKAATSAEPVDLTRIEGIGPKYAEILIGAGITTYAQIAAMSEDDIVELIKSKGGRKSASMSTWAEQAKLAAAGDWDGLAKLQEALSGGRR